MTQALIAIALKKPGQWFCDHEYRIVRLPVSQEDNRLLRMAVQCRHCLRETHGFVVGNAPETKREG